MFPFLIGFWCDLNCCLGQAGVLLIAIFRASLLIIEITDGLRC